VRDGPNPNRTFAVRRNAAKRGAPWDLKLGDVNLMSPQQAEDIPATKRARLEEPFSATIDRAATNISSRDTVAISLPAATADDADADADPVKGTWTTGHWTPAEDKKRKSAGPGSSGKAVLEQME
jgi:hypothetical protein